VAVNKICEPEDMQLVSFQAVVNDLHRIMHVRKVKRESYASCKGKGLLEPAQIHPYKHWDYAWAIVHSQVRKGMMVLDAGAGRGFLQYYLACLGVHVHAVDVIPVESKFIRKLTALAAQAHLPLRTDPMRVTKKLQRRYKTRLDYRLESVSDLSYADHTFDRVFSISVLEHLDDPTLQGGLREMARVLKPQGWLVLTIDYTPSMAPDRFGFNEHDIVERLVKPLASHGLTPIEPLDLNIPDWEALLQSVNALFETTNRCVSYGMIFEKTISNRLSFLHPPSTGEANGCGNNLSTAK